MPAEAYQGIWNTIDFEVDLNDQPCCYAQSVIYCSMSFHQQVLHCLRLQAEILWG